MRDVTFKADMSNKFFNAPSNSMWRIYSCLLSNVTSELVRHKFGWLAHMSGLLIWMDVNMCPVLLQVNSSSWQVESRVNSVKLLFTALGESLCAWEENNGDNNGVVWPSHKLGQGEEERRVQNTKSAKLFSSHDQAGRVNMYTKEKKKENCMYVEEWSELFGIKNVFVFCWIH